MLIWSGTGINLTFVIEIALYLVGFFAVLQSVLYY